MAKDYVEQRNGGYYIAGTRVSLASLVYCFLNGDAPDTISRDAFPSVSVEQVLGALAFYLANRDEIDAYLKRREAEFARMREESRQNDPEFYAINGSRAPADPALH